MDEPNIDDAQHETEIGLRIEPEKNELPVVLDIEPLPLDPGYSKGIFNNARAKIRPAAKRALEEKLEGFAGTHVPIETHEKLKAQLKAAEDANEWGKRMIDAQRRLYDMRLEMFDELMNKFIELKENNGELHEKLKAAEDANVELSKQLIDAQRKLIDAQNVNASEQSQLNVTISNRGSCDDHSATPNVEDTFPQETTTPAGGKSLFILFFFSLSEVISNFGLIL